MQDAYALSAIEERLARLTEEVAALKAVPLSGGGYVPTYWRRRGVKGINPQSASFALGDAVSHIPVPPDLTTDPPANPDSPSNSSIVEPTDAAFTGFVLGEDPAYKYNADGTLNDDRHAYVVLQGPYGPWKAKVDATGTPAVGDEVGPNGADFQLHKGLTGFKLLEDLGSGIWWVDRVGEKGDPGEDGEDGAIGPQGPPGDPQTPYDLDPADLGVAADPGVSDDYSRGDHVHLMPKLDNLQAPEDNSNLDASTTKHGLLPKAVAPAADQLNVLGIANGETAYTNKTLFSDTDPVDLGEPDPGSAVTASRSDHVHTVPKIDDLAEPDDNTDLNATTSKHGLLPKLGGGTTNFLRADGTWAAPSAAASFSSLVRAYKSGTDGNQSIAEGDGWTLVTFPSETVDRASNFASSVFTAPSTGYYRVRAHVAISGTDNTERGTGGVLALRVGASTYPNYYAFQPDGSAADHVIIDDIMYLEASQTVGLYCRCDDESGESLLIRGQNPSESWFSVEGPL